MHNSELKKIRKAMGLTQLEFSEELGINQANYSRFEKGRNSIPPYIEKLVRLYVQVNGDQGMIDRIGQLEDDKAMLTNEIKKIDRDIEQGKDSLRNRSGGSVLGVEGAK